MTITINDVNDAPAFNNDNVKKELWVTEGQAGDGLRVGKAESAEGLSNDAYVATDADAGDAHNNTNNDSTPKVVALKYSVEGADKGSFTIDAATGVLTLKSDHTPDYEKKSEYSITIVVRDNETPVAGEAKVAVKVKVSNTEDTGKVVLSAREPQVGKSIVATLTDGDTKVRGKSWQWYRNVASGTSTAALGNITTECEADTTVPCKIKDATSPAYQPVDADVQTGDADLLAARVTYSDACVRGAADDPPICDGLDASADPAETDQVDSASVLTQRDTQKEDPGNTAPKFDDDQDPNLAGTQAAATRKVAENADNTDVGDPVTVEDTDLVSFSLGGADAASFKLADPPVGANSVQIKTATKLDYEKKSEYTIVVTATDPAGATDDLTVNIMVEDVDDDATLAPVENAMPAFLDDGDAITEKTIDVPENSTSFDAIKAIDDNDVDEDLTYTLGGADADFFSYADGVLTVDAGTTLDFESDTTSYELELSVSDMKDRFDLDDTVVDATITLTINVTNVNEAPVITEGETAERDVDENSAGGTNVGDPIAFSDVDVGDTATFSIGASGAWAFGIESTDENSIQITVDRGVMLDHETQDSYTVTVTVTDGGGLTDSIEVTISINDVNEAPMFADDSAEMSVAENSAADTDVGSVMASDVDGDTLAYSIDGDSFAIDASSGEITVAADAALDHETQDSYAVTVTATDGDLTDSIEVTISVTDVNEAPMFAEDTAERSVEENSDAGASVGDPVTASDVDADDTLAYSLVMSMSNGEMSNGDEGGDMSSAVFAIDESTGQISVAEGADLDYESQASYSATVTATDAGGLSDSVDVTISLIDVPETPMFPVGRSYTLDVKENSAPGTNISTPVVADLPTSVYSLEGDDADSFEIDSATGQIMTKAALDYETKSSYSVTVKATVMGSDTVDVTISVMDVLPTCYMGDNIGLNNDCEILLGSLDALSGALNLLNWRHHTHTPISEWDGVVLEGEEGMERVTKLDLRDKLAGTIPADLGRLDALKTLWLNRNTLTGGIPASLGDLSSLEDLNLSRNQLTGEIPASLGSLSNLRILRLYYNDLTGEVPDLSGTSLVDLRLQNNELTGGIPTWLGGMTDLELLYLSSNQLGGMIPAELGGMSSLGILTLHVNGLEGTIPAELNNLSNLRSLNLRNNNLTGEVPDLSGLDKLVYLRLHRNQLSGEIPGSLGGAESLERLWAHGNQFTSIGAGLVDAADTLTHLNLRENSFAEGTCLMGGLKDVRTNDFAEADLTACVAPAPTTEDDAGNGGS